MRKLLVRFAILSLTIGMYGCITPGNKDRFNEDPQTSEYLLEGETEETLATDGDNTENQDKTSLTQEEKLDLILDNLTDSQFNLNDAQEKNELLDQQLSETEIALTEAQQSDSTSTDEIDELTEKTNLLKNELEQEKQTITDLESNISLIQDSLAQLTSDEVLGESEKLADESLDNLVAKLESPSVDNNAGITEEISTITTDVIAPTAPQQLTSIGSPNSQIKLSWSKAEDNVAVMGYHIYRNDVFLASTTIEEYIDKTANENISYTYAVSAYDENLNESIQSSTIVIEPIIISANITATNDKFPGDEIVLEGSANSNSNQDVSYLWSIEAKPTTSRIITENSETSTFAFTPDVKGGYTIGLVTSVEGIKSDKTIFVFTALNASPIAKIKSAETFTTVNNTLRLSALNSVDADEDQLTFAWTVLSKPAGSNVKSTSNTDLFDLTPDVAGDYKIQLTANDGEANSLPTNLTINVLTPTFYQSITSIIIESTDTNSSQFNVPVTFGQVFRKGDVSSNSTLTGRLINGSTIPLQVDKKATYDDGSLRHAIITTILPSLEANENKTLELVASEYSFTNSPVNFSETLTSSDDTKIKVVLDDQTYSISAKELLTSDSSKLWLDGPLVKEWHVMSPLKLNNGSEHPHLTAYFNIRYYKQSNTLRSRVTLENNWALQSNPKNLHYSVEISDGSKKLFQQSDVKHFHHARWTKVFWNKPFKIQVKHNKDYLIQTKAIPNYDSNITVRDSDLQKMLDKWDSSISPRSNLPINGIMGTGFIEENFPKTGGRPDIGPLPRWAVRYLLSNDQRAKKVTLGTGEQAGSFPIHLRDKATGLPISLKTYPSLSTHPNIIKNGEGTLAQCTDDCEVPYKPDTAHQPSVAFVPYLMTGDHYFLEELIFWTMWNPLYTAPKNHGFSQGLLNFQQVRGQAWSMRTLTQAALFTPDNYPLKSELNDMLQANLTWYTEKYTNNPDANTLGWVYPISSRDAEPVITPFMDDFFTWSMGYISSMGVNSSNNFLHWKAKFAVNRIIDNGYCWVFASPYRLQIADSKITGWETDKNTEYTTLNQAYLPTVKLALSWLKHDKSTIDATANATVNSACGSLEMAENIHLREGEMVGWAGSAIGFNTALQTALAAAADAGVDNAQLAWDIFMARKIQPNFKTDPQFGIIPR